MLKTFLAGAAGTALILLTGAPVGAVDLNGNGSLKDPVVGPAIYRNWAGFGVAIGGGGTFGNIEVDTGGPVFDGIGYDGLTVDLNGWYYFQYGNLVFGPSIGGQLSNAAVEAGGASLDVDYRFYGDAHLGFTNGDTLFYGLIGLSQTHVALDAAGFDDDILGFRLGGGVKNKRPNGAILGLEVVYTDHEDQEFGRIDLKPEDLTAVAKVGFQF